MQPTYIDIKFSTMVVLMVKFVFATIPAAILVAVIAFSIGAIFGIAPAFFQGFIEGFYS